MTRQRPQSNERSDDSDFLRDRAKDLRHTAPYPEKLLWGVLRGRRLQGLKFRRQVPIDAYIVDFLCHEYLLIVELDGESHRDRGLADQQREAKLRSLGYDVLRISNDDVIQDLETVCLAILKAVEATRDAGRRG